MTAGSVVAPQIIPIRVPHPGKVKKHIDSSTPVEIKSDTPDVTIYYTLDGSKPEIHRRSGLTDSSTLQYRQPIRLPKGKVCVKAAARTSDGRESAVVTKVFLVDCVSSTGVLGSGEKLQQEPEAPGGSDSPAKWTRGLGDTWEDASKEHQMKVQTRSSLKSSISPHFCESTPSKQLVSAPSHYMHSQKNTGLGHLSQKGLTKTQLSRIQRETDFLRCAQCLSPRPSDPFAHFCLQCGAPVPPVPEQRLPPPEGAQMGPCVSCKAVVPMNAATCLVCDTPMAQQRQPQASIKLQDKVICQSCGTGNPVHVDLCLACETRLPKLASAVLRGYSAPPVPRSEGRMVSCSKCGRINTSDARFCDWCGSKPSRLAHHLTCSCCGATIHPYANFCGSCGVFLAGPPRAGSRIAVPGSTEGALEQELHSTFSQDSPTWQPVSSIPSCAVAASRTPSRADRYTQTVGLFYPSGAELNRKSQQAAQEVARLKQARDHKPLPSAVSPGRGYWRQQLDHVCAHLRSYTQNKPEFRALIGEPRMGKMIAAVVQEDGYEVSLTVSFALSGPESLKGTFVENSLDPGEKLLSRVTEGTNGLSGSQSSLASENGMSSGASLGRKRNRKKDVSDSIGKLPESKSEQLMMALGPGGKSQISVVQQLLDEGADPSFKNSEGRPALTVAVINMHHEVIPLLVQKGADIDQQSGPVNNTALHEAASCGSRGLQCAETLLGCSASFKKRNDRGLTAYDLAVQSGCGALVTHIAAKMGQGLVEKLSRPRRDGSLDAV